MLSKCGFIFFAVLIFSIYSEVNSGLTIIDVPKPRAAPDPDWWKNGVFYQIYPRSFKDSDTDGIGDLNGITSKLADLQEAGITGIWLSPIYLSGDVDQGYDVKDFQKIDPVYGTEDDFTKLVTAAHEKNIKVILDFVPNHSSNEHEWFIASVGNIDGFKDFYVWKDGDEGTPPNNWVRFQLFLLYY